MRGRAGGLRVREARPRHDLLRIRVRPRGAAAPGDPVRSAGASGPGAPRPVALWPAEPAPQPAGGEVWGDRVRVTVKFPPGALPGDIRGHHLDQWGRPRRTGAE